MHTQEVIVGGVIGSPLNLLAESETVEDAFSRSERRQHFPK